MSLLPSFRPLPLHQDPDQYPNEGWQRQSERYTTWLRYFTGAVLEEQIGQGAEATAKYPIRINLCRTVATLNAYAVLGDWNEDVFTWRSESFSNAPKPDDDPGLRFLDACGRLSRLNSLYVRQILTQAALGGCIWGIRYDPTLPTRVRWTSIPPEYFFPVFSSLDGRLLEVLIRFRISGVEAKLIYNLEVKDPQVDYQERWTHKHFEVTVNDQVVREGVPRGHVIPFVYMPRPSIVGEPYGDSAFVDVMAVQDELNARLGDVGDAINRETHKDVYVSNIPGSAKSIRRYGRFVDLGTGLSSHSPEVHDVDRGQVPEGSFEFVKTVLSFARYSAGTPPVAFGEDEGSQRSGMTLVFRMWPMLMAGKTVRALVSDGLAELASKTIAVAQAGGFSLDVGDRFYLPDLPAQLPKDREQVVNEVVSLAGVELISPERAVQLLEVPEDEQAEEIARIQKMKEEAQALEMEMVERQAEAKARATPKPAASAGKGKPR